MCKSVENLAKTYAEEYAKSYAVERLLRKGKSLTEIADLLDLDLTEVEEAEKALLATAE